MRSELKLPLPFQTWKLFLRRLLELQKVRHCRDQCFPRRMSIRRNQGTRQFSPHGGPEIPLSASRASNRRHSVSSGPRGSSLSSHPRQSSEGGYSDHHSPPRSQLRMSHGSAIGFTTTTGSGLLSRNYVFFIPSQTAVKNTQGVSGLDLETFPACSRI